MSIKEPSIVINGRTLNTGESMIVRVALETWFMELHDDPGCLGVDEHAMRMRNSYLAALRRIFTMFHREASS